MTTLTLEAGPGLIPEPSIQEAFGVLSGKEDDIQATSQRGSNQESQLEAGKSPNRFSTPEHDSLSETSPYNTGLPNPWSGR